MGFARKMLERQRTAIPATTDSRLPNAAATIADMPLGTQQESARATNAAVASDNLRTKKVYKKPKTLPSRMATNRPPHRYITRLGYTAAARPTRSANGTDRYVIQEIVAVTIH